jgi:hypothetical protein
MIMKALLKFFPGSFIFFYLYILNPHGVYFSYGRGLGIQLDFFPIWLIKYPNLYFPPYLQEMSPLKYTFMFGATFGFYSTPFLSPLAVSESVMHFNYCNFQYAPLISQTLLL